MRRAAPSAYGGWRLVLRGPDGSVRVPAIAAFGAAPDPAIGSDRFAIDGRRLVVVYARCRGMSATRSCDVYRERGRQKLSIRRLSGEGDVLTPVSRTPTAPHAIALDRYRATWLIGPTAHQTDRLTRTRRTADVVVRRGDRALPAGTDSAVVDSNRITRVLTPLGVVALAPVLRWR